MTAEERDDTTMPEIDPNMPPVASGDAVAVGDQPERLDQVVEVTDAGPCRKHVKVTIERTEIDKMFEEKYREIGRSRDMQMRGFRPGKAPRSILVRRYQKEVSAEIKQQVLMASLQQLAEEAKISPLSAPDINPDKIEIPAEGPMLYEFDVEVRPEFDLPEYKGLKLRRPVHTFTDAEINREKNRLLEEDGQVVPKENGECELDDMVVADIHVRYKDQTINELKDIEFRVDKRLALTDGVAENFVNQIAGAKIDEKRNIAIKLSDGLQNSVLRGQTVDAEFTIKDIKTYRLPEWTPDLFKDFGVGDAAELDELIRSALERRLDYTQRQEARKQILDMINDSASLELPPDLLRKQSTRTLQRRIMEMKNAGLPEDQIRGRLAVLQQDVMRSTALLLKEHFVLQKIAEVENIEITDEDIDEEIERLADQSGESARKVRTQMERENLIESLAADLVEKRALDLVLSLAEYEDYELNPEQSEQPIASMGASAVPESALDAPAPADETETGTTPTTP